MPRACKITDEQLKQGVEQGKSQAQIAKQYGVSSAAIYERLKKLQLNAVSGVSKSRKRDPGPRRVIKIIDQNINAVAQLQRINEVANVLLDELTGEEKVIDRMAKAVEGCLLYKGDKAKLREYVKNIILQVRQDQNTALRACGEIRSQLALQLDMFKALYSMQAIDQFQRIVLNAINATDPATRDRIVSELSSQRLLGFDARGSRARS